VEAGRTTLEWDGGSLDELLILLGEQALSAHIEAVRPGSGQSVGLVEVVAGGVSDSIAGDKLGEDAQSFLQKLPGLKFRVSPALPNPDGSLSPPGTDEGSLRDRSLTSLMRYCEDFALTCALEITRDEQNVRISYRRGEIVRILVDGSEAPERLPDVIGWHDGLWRIVLPQLNLPRPRKPQRAAAPAEGSGTLFGIPAPIIPGITAPAAAAPAAPAARALAPGMTAPPVAAAAPPAAAAVMAAPAPAPRPVAPPVASASPPPPAAAPAPAAAPPVATAAPPKAARTEEVSTAPIARSGPAAAPAVAAATIAEAPRAAPAAAVPQPAPAAASASRSREDLARATPPPASAAAATGAAPAQPRTQPPRPTFTGLPLVVHVVLGVALGAAVVAGYWAYLRYGVQLGIR
jgi:hypothetical protein